MKKTYNQPFVEITATLQPMTIVCASITKGAPVPEGGTMYGD